MKRGGHNFIDLTGKRFGLLVAEERLAKTASGVIKWRCRCDCGNKHVTSRNTLRAGDIVSCGCLRSQQLAERNTGPLRSNRKRKYGDIPTKDMPEYRAWQNMLGTIRRSSATYDENWRSFRIFLSDMGPRPPNTSLFRRNRNLPFSKSNCYWGPKRNNRGSKSYKQIKDTNEWTWQEQGS